MAAAGVAFETGHTDMIHDAQLDYYGQRLATASSDSSIKIFDVAKEDQMIQLAELRGHDGPVWQVAWAHPSFGRLLASVSYDRRVIVWQEQGDQPGSQSDNNTPQEHWSKIFQDSTSHQGSLTCVAWAPHSYGLVLAVGSADGQVSVYTHTPQTQQWQRQTFVAHRGGVNSVSWGPDIKTGALVLANPNPAAGGAPAGSVRPPLRLLTSGCDNQLHIWQWNAEERAWRAQRDLWVGGDNRHGEDWVRDAQWAPGLGLPRGTIASCSEDGSVVIWNEQPNGQWKRKWRHQFRDRVYRVSWSTMGNILAVSQGDGTVSLWKEVGEGDWHNINAVVQQGPPSGPKKTIPEPVAQPTQQQPQAQQNSASASRGPPSNGAAVSRPTGFQPGPMSGNTGPSGIAPQQQHSSFGPPRSGPHASAAFPPQPSQPQRLPNQGFGGPAGMPSNPPPAAGNFGYSSSATPQGRYAVNSGF